MHGLDRAKEKQHNAAALNDATQAAVVKLVMRKWAAKPQPRPRSELQANMVRLWSGHLLGTLRESQPLPTQRV